MLIFPSSKSHEKSQSHIFPPGKDAEQCGARALSRSENVSSSDVEGQLGCRDP